MTGQQSFEDLLQSGQSKAKANTIVDEVFKNPSRLDELLTLFLGDDHRLNQRASWPLIDIFLNRPDWLKPHLRALLDRLDKPIHNAGPRNVMRILQDVEIPNEFQGEIYDRAMKYILQPKTPIAIKAFSLSVAAKIASKFPELSNEVLSACDLIEEPSMALKVRIRNVRRLLKN